MSLSSKALLALNLVFSVPDRIVTKLLSGSWTRAPGWSLQHLFVAFLVRRVIQFHSFVRWPQDLPLTPGPQKYRFQTVDAAASWLYKSPLDKGAAPEAIGGTWYPEPPATPVTLPSSSYVFLHFHGGSFVTGDGRDNTLGFLCSTLLGQDGIARIFAPQYRLASRPGCHAFPAALQDALTGYLYLIQDLRVPPRHLILSGDSAGANLVIGLVRYLEVHGRELQIPLPHKAVLISPWVSPKAVIGPEIVLTSNPNYSTDYLHHSQLIWGATAYAGTTSVDDPFISPLGHPFCTSVPVMVTVGEFEIFEMEIQRWVKEMAGVDGNSMELFCEPRAPHDTLLMGGAMGWSSSAETVAASIGDFIRSGGLKYESR